MENLLYSPYKMNLPYWKNQSFPKKDQKFTDPFFPPNINSLLSKNDKGEFIDKKHGPKMENRIKVEEITWMRASEIFKNQKYSLFEKKIEDAEISQGSLGDCYFLASISSLTQYPKIIYEIFKTKNINEEGYFELIIFIDGKFQIVLVDDYLPVFSKNKKICFSKLNNNEIWICILEKAWAKINGGYTNIIKGWMRHVLFAFTGFQSEIFKHTKTTIENLWKIISDAQKNNFIMTCSTKNNVDKYGLVNSHAYSFFGCVEIISKGRIIKLIKIKSIWKNKRWNGDWGDESLLWGDEEKKQVNYCRKSKELFFMSFQDFYNYFDLTEICYLLFKSYSKSYYINEANINNGNIFNIYLEEDGYFSISLIRKMWRFNRQLLNNIIPSYLFIVSYNPFKDNINNYFYDYDGINESLEDASLFKFLKKGYYLIYAYHDLNYSTLKKEDYYIIKFDSPIKFKHKLMQNDYKGMNFIFLKNIIMQIILGKNEDFKLNQKYIFIGNKIKKDGLGYKMIYNYKNKWMNYIEDYSELKNMFFLSPYLNKKNKEEIEWYIPPKGINIILGMRIDSKFPCNFSFKSKAFILEKVSKNILNNNEKINIKEYANNSVYYENQNSLQFYDYITISLNESKEDLSLNLKRKLNIIKESFDSKYIKIIRLLKKLQKCNNEIRLEWSIINNQNYEYVGQINNLKEKEGKGCLIYKNSDHVIIGCFKGGKIYGKGTVYNKALDKKYFEGNFISGKKSGKGILYFFNGDRYEGEFENDKRNGKGIYYFNTEKGEQKWEGNFIDGNMEGEGIFTNDEGKKEVIKYHKGKQVIY